MLPPFDILGRTFTTYQFLVVAGIIAAGVYACHVCKKAGHNDTDLTILLLVSLAGGFLGSHILYGIININGLISFFSNESVKKSLGSVFSAIYLTLGGSVFYGGLLGGVFTAAIFLRAKPHFKHLVDYAAPAIPLFHFFGRVGCFLGGCCFGLPCKFGFVYNHSPIEEANGISRFPVQLAEALFNLSLFFLLNHFLKNKKFENKLIYVYLILYAIGRFFLEFLRGDAYRGIWLILSTSQIISIMIIAFVLTRGFMMNKLKLTAVLLAGLVILGSCSNKAKLSFEFPEQALASIPYPDVSFAVISDLHVYDPSLGTSGAAFEKTMNSDRKLLLDSQDLLDYAIGEIIGSGVSMVLISGDLTKDGEAINHRIVAEKLKAFTDAGIAVFVVPGNHDVNNPDAVSYSGETTTPVPSISAEDFAAIYGNYGFNAAFARDGDSLSYVAEPVEGLWILAIDSCRYRENVPGKGEIVGGKISQQTADWIASVLKRASAENKAVIALMHHGVVEHWKGQSKLHPDYLIDGYESLGEFFAAWNVRLVFTGHYHAQDAALASFGDKFIYDIETGSLVTAPCPIRYAEINDNVLQIRTDTIVEKLHPGTNFAVNARAFVKKTVMLEAISVLKDYFVSDKDANYIANAVGDGFDAHYAGDEDPALFPGFDKKQLGLWGRFIYGQQKYVIDGLWIDLPPKDNNLRIEL